MPATAATVGSNSPRPVATASGTILAQLGTAMRLSLEFEHQDRRLSGQSYEN